MNKKLLLTSFTLGTILLACSLFVHTALADPILAEVDIDLPSGCTVTDSDGMTHVFPKEDSPSEFLAICALDTAEEEGHISDFKLTNDAAFGLYVASINGIEPAGTEYWALWLNGGFADCGVGGLVMNEADTLSFILTDWTTNTESSTIILHIAELASTEIPVTVAAANSGPILPPPFDIEKALNYLKSVQGPDGSFGGEGLYTDWAAIAFGAANVAGEPVEKITSYFSSHNQISPLLTDNERRAMALLALGLNPYDWHGVNYIEAILRSWDGNQFGNPELVNDDIFALLPLQKAGFTMKNDMIKKDLAFIISKQRKNGSWEESVDMTAAAIQALRPFQDNNNGVYDSLTQAMSYMFNNQGATGGWDSVYSTSWAAQAMHSVDASWVKYGYSPSDYLSLEQAADGGMLPVSATLENRVWATSYAIPAVLGKSWNEILRPATRPALPETIQSTEVKNTQATPVISPAQITQDNPVEILPEIPTEITAAVLTAEVIDSLPSDGNSSAGNLPVVLSLLGGAILIILLGKLFLV